MLLLNGLLSNYALVYVKLIKWFIDFCFFVQVLAAEQPEEITEAIELMRSLEGPVLLEIKTNKGGRKDLGRPTRSPIQNKKDFMHIDFMHTDIDFMHTSQPLTTNCNNSLW